MPVGVSDLSSVSREVCVVESVCSDCVTPILNGSFNRKISSRKGKKHSKAQKAFHKFFGIAFCKLFSFFFCLGTQCIPFLCDTSIL